MDSTTQGPFEILAACSEAQLDALRQLAFKFEVQHMMLSSGRGVWLSETMGELEQAVFAVNHADADFRAALCQVALSLGVSPESTFREVAEVSPEPWRYIFEQGREDLVTSVERVGRLSTENRKLLARGLLATSAALSLLGVDMPSAYDATGAPNVATGSVNLLNVKA